MTQEQIIALERVLDLAEIASNDCDERHSDDDNANQKALDLINWYLIQQRTLAKLQARINAL